jgi:hypothetical protein
MWAPSDRRANDGRPGRHSSVGPLQRIPSYMYPLVLITLRKHVGRGWPEAGEHPFLVIEIVAFAQLSHREGKVRASRPERWRGAASRKATGAALVGRYLGGRGDARDSCVHTVLIYEVQYGAHGKEPCVSGP